MKESEVRIVDGKVEIWAKAESLDENLLLAEKTRLKSMLELDQMDIGLIGVHMRRVNQGMTFHDSVKLRLADIEEMLGQIKEAQEK